MCLHHVHEDTSCPKCDRMIVKGVTTERLLYTQQRVWQLEMKAKGRCEICGRRKLKCASRSRCTNCLIRDLKRHRKRAGTRNRKWYPGGRGRPRIVSENYAKNLPAMRERARKMLEAVAAKRAAAKISSSTNLKGEVNNVD